MKKCIICKIHKQLQESNIIFMNEIVTVRHGPLESNILGYCYIEPNRHVESWSALTDEELIFISKLIGKLSLFLETELKAERVYTVTISEVVKHLHVHIIPRVAEEVFKGLSLIEQATQSRVKTQNNITKKEINEFIEVARRYLNLS